MWEEDIQELDSQFYTSPQGPPKISISIEYR
jgi:hypothetical protein